MWHGKVYCHKMQYTVKILKIGTHKIIAIIVLTMEKIWFTILQPKMQVYGKANNKIVLFGPGSALFFSNLLVSNKNLYSKNCITPISDILTK